MENKFYVNRLLDFYGTLLTDKQRSVCSYYYRDDYSLQEISEIAGISRSGVLDMIQRCRKKMESYEKNLHLAESFDRRIQIYEKIRSLSSQEVSDLIDQCIETEIFEVENYE